MDNIEFSKQRNLLANFYGDGLPCESVIKDRCLDLEQLRGLRAMNTGIQILNETLRNGVVAC